MGRSDPTLALEEAKVAAKAAENRGEWDNARRAVGRALELAPDDPDLHQRMSWLVSNSTELDEAERARLTAQHWEMSVKLKSRLVPGSRERRPSDAAGQRIGTPVSVPIGPQRKSPSARMPDLTDSEPRAPTRSRTKVSLPFRVLLGAGLLAGLIWGIASAVSAASQSGNGELQQQLGTRLTVHESRKAAKRLAIEVQKSWLSIKEEEQPAEVALIREAAKKLGFEEVLVYSGGGLVGHSAGDIACVHPACLSRVPAL